MLALALQGGGAASLREGTAAAAEKYWLAYGGEGSLRGVEHDAIHVPGGGTPRPKHARGIALISEKTSALLAFGIGAQVWRKPSQATLWGQWLMAMGWGCATSLGFPLRFDVAFNDGSLDKPI